jgi:hypothetical protein
MCKSPAQYICDEHGEVKKENLPLLKEREHIGYNQKL